MCKISFSQLANRLMREKPSRELDCLIAVTAGGYTTKICLGTTIYCSTDNEGVLYEPSVCTPDMLVPKYTTSIDAAVKLVPEGCDWLIGRCTHGRPDFAKAGSDEIHEACNPAMALCVGALRARSAMI